MKRIGLYLHFPFCIKKCYYCDFPSYSGMMDRMDDYIEALCKEIKLYVPVSQEYIIETIFLGGGTPTFFHVRLLGDVIKTCNKVFNFSSDVEITIECNPGTVDYDKLMCLKNEGINRLSIGLQAWQNKHLEKLGRIHKHEDFIKTVEDARKAGFNNINADLMFGLPDQTADEWLETVQGAANLGLEHISTYSLKIEEGTMFYKLYYDNKLNLPDDSMEREMYHSGINLLEAVGLKQYEISNFAVLGKECRHNLNYWRNGEYIGCGSSAHSFLNKVRYSNACNVDDYITMIKKGNTPVTFFENIDTETEIFESIMLGLRLKQGINEYDFFKRFGFYLSERYNKAVKDLVNNGMLIFEDGFIKPTLKGMDYQNQIALAFMP